MSARQSIARRKMLSEPGRIYAAYSKEKCWIKLGFSLDVERRLGEINHRFHLLAPFSLIGSTPSLYEAERQIHRILSPFRHHQVGLSREIYLAIPIVERVVLSVVEGIDRPPMDYRAVHECALWAIRKASPIRDVVRHFYAVAHHSNYHEIPE